MRMLLVALLLTIVASAPGCGDEPDTTTPQGHSANKPAVTSEPQLEAEAAVDEAHAAAAESTGNERIE